MDDKGTDEQKGSSGTIIAVIVIIVVVVVGFVMFGKKGMYEPIVAGKVATRF